MNETPSKRRRTELSLEDKIKIIRESEMVPKPTLKLLSEKYGIGKSTVADMSSDNLVDDDEFDDDDVPLNVLVQQFRYTCEDLENFDHDVPTEDNSDEWECNLVQSFKESSETTCDVCDTETDDVQQHLPGSELTHSEVLEMLIKIKNFATEKDSDYLNTVQELQMLTERKIVRAKCVQKQSTIDSFFKKSDA